jgi:hypothetical protein
MPAAIMVGSAVTDSANHSDYHIASATTCFSAATSLHLLITFLAVAVVMIMGSGLVLFGSGISAAPCPFPVTGWTVTGVRWGHESWTRPVGGFRASAPPRSLAGPARLTAVLSHDKGLSQPLLSNHVELAAAEQAQCDTVTPRGRGAAGSPSACAAELGLRDPLAAHGDSSSARDPNAHSDSSSARDPNEPSLWPAQPASRPVFRPITKPFSQLSIFFHKKLFSAYHSIYVYSNLFHQQHIFTRNKLLLIMKS